LVIFLFPIFTLSAHAFSTHEHSVCISKVEKHVHKKDVDCQLDVYQTDDFLLIENIFFIAVYAPIYKSNRLPYNFLKNHSQLSFSLRGPPVYI